MNPNLKLNPKLFQEDIDPVRGRKGSSHTSSLRDKQRASASNGVEQVPTRFGYGEGLVIAGKENPNVVAPCAGLTESTRTSVFQKEFPDRVVGGGICEQKMG